MLIENILQRDLGFRPRTPSLAQQGQAYATAVFPIDAQQGNTR